MMYQYIFNQSSLNLKQTWGESRRYKQKKKEKTIQRLKKEHCITGKCDKDKNFSKREKYKNVRQQTV